MSDYKPPLLENATRDLARFGAELTYEQIPAVAIDRIKSSVLDALGCCLFGATLPWTRKVARLVEVEGAQPKAALFGMGRKTSASLAALVNSTAGHAFELDDIHKESIVHPNSIATPVALAMAEEAGRGTGKELITAIVAGYEIGTRVGSGGAMSLFFRGFHPQGTSGVFVAAATAARLLGLNAERFQHALGIAGSQAGGLMAAQEGAMVKRFHSGRAAQSGIYAARLAQDDFTGIVDVVEAAYGGFLSSYADEPNARRVTEGLGTTWETLQIGYKPHATVTSIHSALDAMLELMCGNDIKAEDIARVEAGLSPMTYLHCAWEYKAQGVTAAQMNVYYNLAMIAFDGAAFTEQFMPHRLAEPRTMEFIQRIRAYVDPEIEAMGAPFRHASRLKITTHDGRTFEKLARDRRGSPENPIGRAEIVAKFHAVVAPCLERARAEKIVALVDKLETLECLDELVALVAAPVQQETP